MLNNTAPITNEELSDNQIIQLLDAIAPDTSVIVSVTSTPTSTSPYTTKCAGWYVLLADTTTKRYLYINGKQTPYSIPANNSSVSVFLAKVIQFTGLVHLLLFILKSLFLQEVVSIKSL